MTLHHRIVVVAALAAGCAPRAPVAPAPATVTLTPATVPGAEGDVVRFERGMLHVRENRRAATSRTIAIAFARLPGPAGSAAPPIVFLPGGPGASYLDAFDGGSPNAERRLAMFRRYAAVADVIVLDQRGHSPAGTPLRAPAPIALALDQPNSIAASAVQWRAYARALALANPEADLAGYDLVQVATDVDELRAALGYRQVSLLATSFGSQSALAVIRLFPDRVARALLSGLEPLDHNFDLPSATVAALERIAADADAAPNLRSYLPRGGLRAAIEALLQRFAAGPITVALPDGAVVLGLEDLQSTLVPAADAVDWPAWVLALYHGHYDDWARAERDARRGAPFLAPVNPLIDASLGITAARAARLHADPAIRVLGRWGFAVHEATRDAWPTADIGDALRAFTRIAVPIVVVQGDWDTSTPVENAREAMPWLARGHLVVVHRGEHAPPSRLLREHAAVFAAALEFLRTGATAGLPAEVSLAPMAFTTPAFPPPAP